MLRPFSLILLLSILAASLIINACSDSSNKKMTAPLAIGGLSTIQAKATETAEAIEATGTVKARATALVSARIPGTVSRLNVHEGDRVKTGQLLGRLDSRENNAYAAGASASIDEARRNLDDANSRHQLAATTFERFRRLYNDQALTQQEYDTRKTELDLAKQAVSRAESRLRQTEEAARAVGVIADYTRIVAPISGIIIERQAETGATVFPGQPLMVIEDDSGYQLDLAVPESFTRNLHIGTVVYVTIDALGKSFNTPITEIVPASSPGSRTFTAKANIPVKGARSGMFGRGKIMAGTVRKGIHLPKSTLVERGSLTSVWVVGADDIIRMRLVKTGIAVGDNIEILAGLSEGDLIVLEGKEKVVDGARILKTGDSKL